MNSLDQIVVVDVQTTCWDGAPPPGETSEIIMVSACLLNVETCERGAGGCFLVRPERSRVSAFCEELTALRQEQVANAHTFERICAGYLDPLYAPRSRRWATYGSHQRRTIEHECQARDIPCPFGSSHIDVKALAALVFGWGEHVPLLEAALRLKIGSEGRHVRIVDGADIVAAILARIITAARGGTNH